MRLGTAFGQTPGVGPGGHGAASAEKQLSFPRGKATDAAATGCRRQRCHHTNARGCGRVWGGGQARNRGRRRKGIRTSPGPRCAGGSRSRGAQRWQCRGLRPGPGALGLAPSRVARLSPGGCVSVRVRGLGGQGGRVRDGDEPQGRGTGEELFCLGLVNKWERGMCRR